MKKRVRVYKPGGQTNQPTQEQIVDYISQRMSADDFDGDTDSLKAELSQAGIEDSIADDYISYVSDNLGLEDASQLDEETQVAAEQEQANSDEEQALLEEQQAAEEQARQQQQAAMYNVEVNPEDTEDTPEDEATYMRQGGTNLSKRSFIKQYTKFAKMAQGGDTPSPGADDVLNGRESHVKGFLGAVRNTAQEAAMKQEAEDEYNSAYGAPQVGAFQEGGIQQEQIDFENPYHHLGLYGEDTRHIFSQDQNIQNDAPERQFGGFTDTDAGLYKFIGGGDNESADEMYQDSDIDFNQEQYQNGGFRMPRRSGRQYAQAVNSPYYTATGQRAVAPNLAGRQVTSVNVTKRGIFGRPKAYTVNYNGTPSVAPTGKTTLGEEKTNTIGVKTPPVPGEYAGPDNITGKRQPVADWMMRSGIPGIKQWGANMTRSGMIPEIPADSQPTSSATAPTSDMPYYPPMNARAQRRESRDDAKLNRFLGNNNVDKFNDPEEVKRIQQKMPAYKPFNNEDIPDSNTKPELINTPENQNQINAAKKIEALIGNNSNASDADNTYQDFLIKRQGPAYKEYGGPINYTQYAYGGDIAVPELYRAQMGAQTNVFDPNANPLGTKKDYKGDTVDFTGKVIKKRNPNFSIGEGTADIKVPGTMDESYKNPLTGEKPGVIMNNKGEYADNGLVDEATKTDDTAYSQDYLLKRDRSNLGKNVSDAGQVLGYGLKAGLDFADKINARKQENQLLANTTSAEANYGVSNIKKKGNYDPNSGLFRPDQMGSNAVVKYGGGIYATGGSTADEDEDVQYMTQEEIDDFIANGGELEYL